MKKSRFSESQIVAILKEGENGIKVEQLCRHHGISSATYYNWKSKYGGLEASELKRIKELEEENARLKRMYATLSMDLEIFKEVMAKKRLVAAAKHELVKTCQQRGMGIS